MIEKPLVLLNFKRSTGEKAMILAKGLSGLCFDIRHLFEIAFVVDPSDAFLIQGTGVPVFIHDMYLSNSLHETIGGDYLTTCRISGILTNHPENRQSEKALRSSCKLARQANLKLIIGASSINEALVINDVHAPDYVAIENAEMIGRDISISRKYPRLVEDAVATVPGKLLFGAGVRSSQDVKHVMDNRGAGVLVSSAVIGAEDPSRAFRELLDCGEVGV